MKKNRVITMIVMAVILFTVLSCNSGLSNGSSMKESGERRIDRSQRTVIDGSKYVDFTLKTINPAKYTKMDIMYELNNTYKLAGGNSFITINKTDGTITLSSDEAFFEDKTNCNMYAKYRFDVQAAGSDCLYIKMDAKKRGSMVIDQRAFKNHEIPDLAVCVPLYGFSRNRIEVSPIMNGYSAMPSGTYWAVK